MFIIELEPGVYLAPWEGDPGRTLKIKNAISYDSFESAMTALVDVQEYREFTNAKILEVG